MDEIDHALIGLLRQDARMSVADLAHKLKVSRGTVTNRIRKMEEQQIIVGYTVRLRPEAEPERIHWIAELAWRWCQLRSKPAAQKRAALVLANYPGSEARMGRA